MASDKDQSVSSSGTSSSRSDSEDESLLQPMEALSSDLTNQELCAILKANQINHQLLANRCKALKIENNNLMASHKSKTKGLKGSAEVVKKEIKHAGGRFSVVGKLWVSRAMLDIPFPENFDPSNPAHYSDPNAEAHGTISELYMDLKPHLQSYLADPFQAGVSRSSSTPISSSGAAPAPALVAELPMQMHAVNQARTSAAAAGNKLEQPVESNCHGRSKKSKTKKVSKE
ncbi:hypothetical protein V8E53_004713 [Lactarius tabidus]